MQHSPNCQHCDSAMKKARDVSAGRLACGLFFLILGIVISLSVVGAIIGIPMALMGLCIGDGKRCWRCSNCRAIVARG